MPEPHFRVSDHRKAIPMGVKLEACLLLLGFTLRQIRSKGAIQWDHSPCLKDRKWDAKAGDFVPAQHDPRFIAPMLKTAHRAKTFGPGGVLTIHSRNSDISEPKRIARISEKHADFQRRLMTPDKQADEKPRSKPKWPSRPFNCKTRTK